MLGAAFFGGKGRLRAAKNAKACEAERDDENFVHFQFP